MLSRGRSLVVDVLVLLTWTFVVPPIAMLALLPWRQLLPTGRLLLLMGVGLVMAVLTVTAELWRRRGDRAQRRFDAIAFALRDAHQRAVVKVMGPLRCGRCGARLTEGDARHPDYGPVDGPTVGCETCDHTVRAFTMLVS